MSAVEEGGWDALKERLGLKEPDPEIGRLAVLSDGRTVAIISPTGTVCWMCVPDMAAPSIFASLLRGIGHWKLVPSSDVLSVTRSYEPGTMVLKTTYMTRKGTIVVLDFMVWTLDGRRDVLIRKVTCVEGSVPIHVECVPVFQYDSEPAEWQAHDEDGHHGITERKGLELEFFSNMEVQFADAKAISVPTLKKGETAFYALEWGEGSPPTSKEEVDELLRLTTEGSRNWLREGKIPEHPLWGSAISPHALVLRGLVHYPSGAIAAAATTSLPETLEGEKTGEGRTWDYRFCWIRDAAMTAITLHLCGFETEAVGLIDFILNLPDLREELLVMYGIGGQVKQMKERKHAFLKGWRGLGPVRIGNDAHRQAQFDLWGWILLLAYLVWKDQDGRISKARWRTLVHFVEKANEAWERPDSGMWESRGGQKRFTSSNLLLWVALACGANLARKQGRLYAKYASRWAKRAEEMRAWILSETVDENGVFRIAPGEPDVEISVLLIPLLGLVEPTDSRVLNTIAAVQKDLCYGGKGLPVRYPQSFDDGMGHTKEGAWFIGAGWLVAALALAGKKAEAENLMKELLSHGGELGLLAEQVDPETREQLGNFPQAFSHIGVILALLTLIHGEAVLAVEHPATANGNDRT